MIPTKTLPCLEQELDDCLSKLAAQAKSRAKAGYNDACKRAEVVIRNLMNVLYGYALRLEGKVNASGFDLCDTTNKILVQVTVNCTDTKVDDCLRTTCERVAKEPHLNNSTLYIMFLTVDDDEINKLKKNAANKLGKPEDGDKRKLKSHAFPVTGIQFTPADGIISLNTLLKQIRDDETAYGKPLTIAQVHGIQEILDKYYQTIYFATESGNQLPKNGSVCFTPAPGAGKHNRLCLADIYQMLADDSDNWVGHIAGRLGRSDIQLHTSSSPVLPFPPEPGEEFLRTFLSEWIMDDIRLEAPSNPDVYQQVMNGTYPEKLRKKIYRDLMTDTGRRFEHMLQRCDHLDVDINAFLTRANILLELLETEQTPRSPVRDLYIQYQNSNDRCRGLAAFILYALVGHSLFNSILKKYIH